MLKIKPLVNSQCVCYMIQKNQNPFTKGLSHLSKICTLEQNVEFTLNFWGFPYETSLFPFYMYVHVLIAFKVLLLT